MTTADTAQGTVLVTGGTGFVGGALVRALLASGLPSRRLRCLVREPARAAAAGIPPECAVAGELTDQGSLERAADGVGLVYHVAGTVRALRHTDFHAANAEGTRQLVRALERRAGAAGLVLVSSLAAAGPSRDGANSALPPDRCRPCSRYGESKRRGELHVLGARGLRSTIVRPPLVYGPGDGATQLLFRQALLPFTPVPPRPRPLSAIHVDDVVRALLLCGEGRAWGSVLPLDGPQRTTTHDLVRAFAAACGRKARLLPVPLLAARAAALLADLHARLRARPGYFSLDKVRELSAPGWVADGGAAERLLGFRAQIRLAEGLRSVALAEGFARP